MKQNKTANFFHATWIVLSSFAITGIYSLRTIIAALLFKGDKLREKGDYLTRAWSAALLKVINIDYSVHNNFNFQAGKQYIVMCNHNSAYDIPLSFMATQGSLRMIAKKEISKIPLLGRAMSMLDFIFIDRKNREQAVKDLELAKQKMASGIIIWICPEGTRSRTGELQRLKPGGFMMAIQTGATIVPLGIRGSDSLVDPEKRKIRLNHHIDMHFGEPIDATQYDIKTRKQLIAKVEHELKVAAGLDTFKKPNNAVV